MNKFLIAAAILGSCFAFDSAFATTTTGTIAVNAQVSTVCSVTTTALQFGEVSLSGTTNGTGSIGVTCTDGGTYNVGLDNGTNSNAAQRRLAGGTNFLNYDLYQGSGYATRWGNDIGTDTVSGTGNGSAQNLTVYGQIASGQTLVSGTGSLSYTNSITVTVTY